jgi:hypothetical protein
VAGHQRGLSVVCAMAVLSSTCGTPPVQSRTMTPLPEAARAQLAPHGRLRAALNHSNFLLVSSRAPDAAGVAPTLARELARRANAVVEFVGYENAGLAADAAAADAWDVAFIAAEPARARDIRFSPAYVEIEATYLVPAASPLRSTGSIAPESALPRRRVRRTPCTCSAPFSMPRSSRQRRSRRRSSCSPRRASMPWPG